MGKVIYENTIPLNPFPKKNNGRIFYNKKTKKPFIMPAKNYKKFEKACKEYVEPLSEPIETPVNIEVLFYRKTRHRVDLTNLLEAIDDILEKYDVIKDDYYKIVAGHDGSRVYIDKENPRLEIKITEMDE